MANALVHERLAGIQRVLMGVHQASSPLSANSRGDERQAFVSRFLAEVLPPVYRFGTGDATDAGGTRSGQLDVVIEYPFSPSLPSVSGPNSTRLYLAESVAAVIEVKSDVSKQWQEAQYTASQLAPLQRKFGSTMSMGPPPTPKIPLFVAGYTGWKNTDTLQRRMTENPHITGILVIEEGFFVSSTEYGVVAEGPWALWGLICTLHLITNGLQAASTDPGMYAR